MSALSRFEVYVATKMYSSWSLRGWLGCRVALGKDFSEVKLPIAGDGAPAETRQACKDAILKYSPTGKVPALLDRNIGVVVYDSIAILLHLADQFPSSGLLPSDPAGRALCLSACAEMHSGFTALRSNWPHNCVSKARIHGASTIASNADLRADINRLGILFTELRTLFGESSTGGKYLFGKNVSAADCMYAPVALRFRTYDPDLTSMAAYPAAAEYLRSLWENEFVSEWVSEAESEGPALKIPQYELYNDN